MIPPFPSILEEFCPRPLAIGGKSLYNIVCLIQALPLSGGAQPLEEFKWLWI